MLVCFPVTCYVQSRCSLKYCAFNICLTVPASANLTVMELTAEEAEANSFTNLSTVHLAFTTQPS